MRTRLFDTVYRDFDLLVRYKDYRTGQGSMYQKAVHDFLAFHEKKGLHQLQFGRDEMAQYFDYLITRPNERRGGRLAYNTVNHHLFAIRIFLDMLIEMKLIDTYPYLPKFFRGHSMKDVVLTQDEVKLVYDHCQNPLETAILSTAYGCGLRRTELERLDAADLKLGESILIVREGKGSKRREVPLSEKVKKDFRKYLRNERPKRIRTDQNPETAFFINQYGRRMAGQDYYRSLRRLLKRTKNDEILAKNIDLHSLRRSIATHLAENGAGIDFVKSFLGHVEIDTSQLYAIRRRKEGVR